MIKGVLPGRDIITTGAERFHGVDVLLQPRILPTLLSGTSYSV